MNTSVTCTLVEIDHEWDNKIQAFDFDIYHMSGWIKSSALIDQGEPKGLIITLNEKTLLFPLIIRRLDDKYWDITSTYGYSGVLAGTNLTETEIDKMLTATIDYLKNKHCVSWFLRLHPILNANWFSHVGHLVAHGPTLSSDLTKTAEEHWAETQLRHQRGIKKAQKVGVTTKIEQLNNQNLEIFIHIYEETMRMLGATAFYFFHKQYYDSLLQLLHNNIILITAFNKKQKPIASSMYTYCQKSGIMQHHLGGTLDDYRELQPSKLITHEARKWGRENHYKVLHFGGGLGAQKDSLYEYKKGFSSNSHIFKTHRIVINQNVYHQLCHAKGCTEEQIHNLTEYFPLYRK
ncbi:peptidoglycan bridge formation glycyltransferase FemA/FemB family protein [Pasteurella multocida]|uniref:GNAT family N-acetyltransferase n=1 Tax=Pasteurella multocida TaxID=747 RepID=UPI002D1E6718|nr:GNAT family N-acetyltransferase [Pasteurella multocida]MEB4494405.1 peptidoglycan bridge formation glycyltransferase FemA/FemB family protein [Pasteurella multocida]MEB4501913.1 peptidoglycan bridge formation glycyltransferase FemA/FemB family protein [Pasteurella multocida]MEB4511835.1 peptidoglycan bridge formation glycyltransferase FemA/FemB family protein [Pasteurella multocida]MEB4532136.1 peptidoglycan bridge formation glycyltransferase FemA/FemB family protein [Pasteurella multocida]